MSGALVRFEVRPAATADAVHLVLEGGLCVGMPIQAGPWRARASET